MCYEEMIARISPKLKSIAHRLNWNFGFFNADDLYQEALTHLWADYKEGKLINDTDSYILQGCYFYLRNYIRKASDRAKLISLENMADDEGKAFSLEDILSLEDPQSCVKLVDYKMLVERINNNGLTKREKEVFNLALEGLTTREIGNRLGISHVRVVKLKCRLRDKCRKYVESF